MSNPTIELEAGKRYLTRAGNVVGPLQLLEQGAFYPFLDPATRELYSPNGHLWLGEETSGDLVALAPGDAPDTAESVLRALMDAIGPNVDTVAAPEPFRVAYTAARRFLNNQPR